MDRQSPREPSCQPFRIGDPMAACPSPLLVAGVDIAAASFVASWARPGQVPSTPHPFDQTPAGFASFQKQLAANSGAPETTLVVLEATGSYWVALAVELHSAGYRVAV